MTFEIRAAEDRDREWIRKVIREHWASEIVVTRGKVYHADKLEGFIAEKGAERAGLLTYRLEGDECEIMTLNSLRERQGIGTALQGMRGSCTWRRDRLSETVRRGA